MADHRAAPYAIETEALTRVYGRDRHRAVDGLTLRIGHGEMFGLLGPNGAGKTSTVKMLMTVLLPTSGSARVMGEDVVARAQSVRRRVGVILGGDAGLYARLSARDNLALFADLYGIPHRVQRRRIPELLDTVGLAGKERKRVETFSRGMKQRLHIARGLLHDPDVVILDEPSNGIDPVGARQLRDLVREQVRTGRTVLLTTHYMFEADELCDRVAVLKDGVKIAEGTPESLKKQTEEQSVLSLRVVGLQDTHTERLRRLAAVESLSVSEQDGSHGLEVYCTRVSDHVDAVLAELHGLSILQFSQREPTLEDAYISLVGRREGPR
ncbi:ATP-binding cassette domain-containing protein [Streptomyces sp. NPDC005863]|uniref:ABC transporter ATP-binding protein n=1 Tax=unclassified Streptomyces TaxID=2593676 RepID=UPI0033C2F7B6